MWTALTRFREPMTLAGVFTLAAVSLGLRFLPAEVLPAAAAALAAYALGFLLFALAQEPGNGRAGSPWWRWPAWRCCWPG